MRDKMHRLVLVACAVAAALAWTASYSTKAEPAPAPPIDVGRYETPWGAGDMRFSGSVAVLTLDDGSVFWGSLGNGGREWNGRWVREPRSARPQPMHHPCSGPRGAVPSSFAVPPGVYWGRFAAHSVRSNTTRALSLTWSSCADAPSGNANRFDVVRAAPVRLTASSTPGLEVPSLPYDGPCHSVPSRAVAEISPCNLDFARPFRIKLLKSMQKPVGRITFTPLVDDPDAVISALQSSRQLPLHPSGREVYQVVRGPKLHMRGSTSDITPPATICEHDFWIVNVIDGNGERHPGNGVITMSCGPNRVGSGVLVARPLRELE